MDFPKTRRIVSLIAHAVLGRAAGVTQEDINTAIDVELDSPLRLFAASPVDSKLYIRASDIPSADGSNKSVGPLGTTVPTLVDEWVDFQAQTTSSLAVLATFPASTVGLFRRCALSLGSDDLLIVSFSSEVAALNLLPNPGTLFQANSIPVGWVDLECTDILGKFKSASAGGNQIVNDDIHRIKAGGGGSGSNSGVAAEPALADATDTFFILFPVPLLSANYVVHAQVTNYTDPNPAFFIATVTQKLPNGFTVKLNAPTDSANYKLSYVVPAVQLILGEYPLALNDLQAVVPMAVPLDNTNYSVIAELVNYTDPNPQFQPVVITAKANGTFTAKWNAPVDSGNYRLAYKVAYFS